MQTCIDAAASWRKASQSVDFPLEGNLGLSFDPSLCSLSRTYTSIVVLPVCETLSLSTDVCLFADIYPFSCRLNILRPLNSTSQTLFRPPPPLLGVLFPRQKLLMLAFQISVVLLLFYGDFHTLFFPVTDDSSPPKTLVLSLPRFVLPSSGSRRGPSLESHESLVHHFR